MSSHHKDKEYAKNFSIIQSSEAVRSVGSTQNCIEYKISALYLNLRAVEKANT